MRLSIWFFSASGRGLVRRGVGSAYKFKSKRSWECTHIQIEEEFEAHQNPLLDFDAAPAPRPANPLFDGDPSPILFDLDESNPQVHQIQPPNLPNPTQSPNSLNSHFKLRVHLCCVLYLNHRQICRREFGCSPLFCSLLEPSPPDSSSTSAALCLNHHHEPQQIIAPSVLPRHASPSPAAARTTLPFTRSDQTTAAQSAATLIYIESWVGRAEALGFSPLSHFHSHRISNEPSTHVSRHLHLVLSRYGSNWLGTWEICNYSKP